MILRILKNVTLRKICCGFDKGLIFLILIIRVLLCLYYKLYDLIYLIATYSTYQETETFFVCNTQIFFTIYITSNYSCIVEKNVLYILKILYTILY